MKKVLIILMLGLIFNLKNYAQCDYFLDKIDEFTNDTNLIIISPILKNLDILSYYDLQLCL
jgi:hypothetical protein